jgi:hypothetical protein
MSTSPSAAKKERLRLRKEKKNKEKKVNEPDRLTSASQKTTPVVSAVKPQKRAHVKKREEEKKADDEVKKNNEDDLDNGSGESDKESRTKLDPMLKPRDGDGYVNPQIDGIAFGLGPHATQNDLLELRDSELANLRAKLQKTHDQLLNVGTSLTTTVVVGDTKLYQLFPERVNAKGHKCLRECLMTESRHSRVCNRERLIPDESRVLISQTLAALGLVPERETKIWES